MSGCERWKQYLIGEHEKLIVAETVARQLVNGGSMIYITGDIHGDAQRIVEFAKRISVSPDDIIILLGDVGANYYLSEQDRRCKELLNSVGCTIFCIHGNHECRPIHIPSYRLTEWNGGMVWVEEKYPNVLFAKDGEIFTLEEQRFLVIGGAYSIDKYWRIRHGAGWWADEQPSDLIKTFVEQQDAINSVDIVLSHTCPLKYEPREAFLPGINQSMVDKSTEKWLDTLEERINYKRWYCGHWHIDKHAEQICFLHRSWEMVANEAMV